MDYTFLYRFIPFIFFLHPFGLARKSRNYIAVMVCGLYLFSSIGSLFVSDKYLLWHDFNNDTFLGFFSYTFFNLPLLYASLAIRPFGDLREFRLDNFTRFFLFFFGLGALYSFVYQFPFVIEALSMSAIEVRGFDEALLPQSIFTTVAVGFPMFLFVYVFFFYLSIVKRWSIMVRFTMFLGSINFILNVLTFSGRDGFVFFFIAFIFGYLLFEPHLTTRAKRSIRLIGLVMLIVSASGIAFITLERFSDGGKDGIEFAFQVGVLNYFSMQPFAYNDLYNDLIRFDDNFSYGRGNFPLFYSWFFETEESERDLSMAYLYNFKGYVGSFYQNGGFGYLTGIISLLYLLFRKMRSMYKYHYLYSFFFLSLYLFFMSSGLFYFRMGNRGGNLFILFSLVIMALFHSIRLRKHALRNFQTVK